MCRLAAYLGPPLALGAFILDPPHSLYRQSWEPRELRYAKLNADGFGFGWYDDDAPLVYRQTTPIWSDANLPALAGVLRAGLWMAMVRSATAGYGLHMDNSQPFVFGRRMFMHNGAVRNFDGRMRRELLEELDDDTVAMIRGRTDSEHLCALMHHFARDAGVEEAMRRCAAWCGRYANAMLNFVVSERDALYAMRHGVGEQAPSLYYLERGQNGDGIILASEKFDDNTLWREAPTGSVVTVRDRDVHIQSI